MSDRFPISRVVAEIWRASQSQPDPLISDLTSPLVFRCLQTVRESNSPSQLTTNLNRLIAKSKANTFVAELAKRAAITSVTAETPAQAWHSNFFTQVTDYLASRDLSGFVGRRYRNENVHQLVEFKQALHDYVRDRLAAVPAREPTSLTAWQSYVRSAVNALTQIRR